MIPTAFTHTHTHDPRFSPRTHDPRQLVILVFISLFRAPTFDLNWIIHACQNNGVSQSLASDQCNFWSSSKTLSLTHGSVHRCVTYNFSHATCLRHSNFSTSALFKWFFLAFWASTRAFLLFGNLRTIRWV